MDVNETDMQGKAAFSTLHAQLTVGESTGHKGQCRYEKAESEEQRGPD